MQSAHPDAHADTAKAHALAPHEVEPLTWGSPLQLAPQAPQFAVSLCSSTHAPLQSVYPELQVNVQAPAVQSACAWATVVVHALPQAPQLAELVDVLTHVVPHNVGVPAGHPVAHAYVLPDSEQTGAAAVHAVLQPPQVAA